MHVFETFMATHEEEKYLLEYVVCDERSNEALD